jgi:membrane protein implicated in regulation of membrane protease activity
MVKGAGLSKVVILSVSLELEPLLMLFFVMCFACLLACLLEGRRRERRGRGKKGEEGEGKRGKKGEDKMERGTEWKHTHTHT